MNKMYRLIIISFFLSTSFGCAAAQVAMEHQDLKTEIQMSDTIFLEIHDDVKKTIYVSIKNTSDKILELDGRVKSRLRNAGYEIVEKPSEAFYHLQANVLYIGKADPSALKESVMGGYGGPVLGAAIGGAISGNVTGALGGMAGGALAEMVAGSLVKNVTYSIVTDIQVAEKTKDRVKQVVDSSLKQGSGTAIKQSSSSVKSRKKYRTRIASSANQVNLEFADAQMQLEDSLARSIAGIF